jgi:hypothetical protein
MFNGSSPNMAKVTQTALPSSHPKRRNNPVHLFAGLSSFSAWFRTDSIHSACTNRLHTMSDLHNRHILQIKKAPANRGFFA